MREHIIINNDRTVTVPTSVTKIGNRFDHNVNKVTFDCPRYADVEQTIDLSAMKIYINYIRPDKKPLSSLAENVTVDEADPTIMHFDFNVTRTVTLMDGVLDCLVCIKSTNSEGVEKHHWNSDIFSKLTVGKGMENEETIAEENIDLITQLLVNLDTTNAEVSDVSERIDGVENRVDSVEGDIDELKSDLGELEYKSLSNETKAVNVTSLFTLNGFLNKQGAFVSNESMLCTDFIKAKQGDVFYLYVAQDDNNSLPIAIYDMNKNFIKGIENKGASYILSYLEYAVEEDCLMRISSVRNQYPLIYMKEHKNNSDVFDSIKNNFGELETYYEDMTQFVLDNGEDNKRIDGDDYIYDYDGGFISDYIKVEEGDIIKVSSYVLYRNPVLILYYGTKKVNKVYGTETGYQTVEVTIPPMVEYIRISSLKKSAGIEFGILKNKTVVEMLNEKTTITYDIPNTHEEMIFENVTNGYIKEDGTIQSGNSYTTTDYIDLDVYDWFHIVSDYAYGACGYVVFDKDKKVLSYIKDSVNTTKRFDIEPKKEYPNGKYIRFCGNTILKVYKRKTSHSISDCSEEAMNTGNVLYNKKIAFCGDSFIEATNLGKPDGYDGYLGCYKSYGWRIANRNKMKLYHDGVSGSTMHIVDADNPNTRYPFAYQRYKNVPNDCDYIILQFGLNESSIANDDSTKGTKESTDATTMWGSWNTVLEYLITNHPTARIGVVMSDAWMPQTYFTTLKEICEWWGVPLLDLGGDQNVPVMNGGRRAGCGLTLNPKVAELRNATFYNAEGDAHPNDAGHEWRSTVIENFIRSL